MSILHQQVYLVKLIIPAIIETPCIYHCGQKLIILIIRMVKRICRIDYFLKHTIILSHIETSTLVTSTHLLCHVSWFKVHTKEDWFGNSAIVCKNKIEEESLFSFIPLQRLIAPCTFGYFTLKFDLDTSETVLVAIPLPFHRCIWSFTGL